MKVDPALAGFDLSVYQNQGEDIIKRLDNLIDNGKLGAVLAAFVLFFFLRQFRMTMVISLAVPLCLLVALTAMHFAGKTLTFGHSIQGAVNFKSFGMVLIGGMTSATLFTLLAVPVFYTLIEDAKNGFNNILASVFTRSSKAETGA